MKIRLWISTLLLVSTTIVVGCGMTGGHNLPPASRLAEPGPGVGGPGPGVLTPPRPPVSPVSAIEPIAQDVGIFEGGSIVEGSSIGGVGGCMCGSGCVAGTGCGGGVIVQDVQVLFSRPETMQIQWDVSGVGQCAPSCSNLPQWN